MQRAVLHFFESAEKWAQCPIEKKRKESGNAANVSKNKDDESFLFHSNIIRKWELTYSLLFKL